MDAAFAPRASHTAAPLPARADVTPVPAAVPTLLPQPSQSVAAATEHSAARFDDGRGRTRADIPGSRLGDEVLREIERETEFDEQTKDLVSKTVDSRTGDVLSQYPAESLLKLRAYVQSEDAKNAEPLLARDA
jgi:hypothetical protein